MADDGVAACRLESVELPVVMRGPRPVVGVGINGSDERMLLDTGAILAAARALDASIDEQARRQRLAP